MSNYKNIYVRIHIYIYFLNNFTHKNLIDNFLRDIKFSFSLDIFY